VGGACAVFAVGKNLEKIYEKKASLLLLLGTDFTIAPIREMI